MAVIIKSPLKIFISVFLNLPFEKNISKIKCYTSLSNIGKGLWKWLKILRDHCIFCHLTCLLGHFAPLVTVMSSFHCPASAPAQKCSLTRLRIYLFLWLLDISWFFSGNFCLPFWWLPQLALNIHLLGEANVSSSHNSQAILNKEADYLQFYLWCPWDIKEST